MPSRTTVSELLAGGRSNSKLIMPFVDSVKPFGLTSYMSLIAQRAKIEGLLVEEDALDALTQHGVTTSLRYSLQRRC